MDKTSPAVGAPLEHRLGPAPRWWHCDTHGPGTRSAWGCPECVREMRGDVARMRAALQRIARWHGEFPATGRHWDEPENTRPMSYSACYGSNGERDYMRQVALDALGPNVGAKLETTAAPK
jgi:hypothetical protein